MTLTLTQTPEATLSTVLRLVHLDADGNPVDAAGMLYWRARGLPEQALTRTAPGTYETTLTPATVDSLGGGRMRPYDVRLASGLSSVVVAAGTVQVVTGYADGEPDTDADPVVVLEVQQRDGVVSLGRIYVPVPGVDGADGASAYQLAVEAGFDGDETEWRDSLRGQDGDDAAPLVVTAQAIDGDGNRVLTFSDGTTTTVPRGPAGTAGAGIADTSGATLTAAWAREIIQSLTGTLTRDGSGRVSGITPGTYRDGSAGTLAVTRDGAGRVTVLTYTHAASGKTIAETITRDGFGRATATAVAVS